LVSELEDMSDIYLIIEGGKGVYNKLGRDIVSYEGRDKDT